MLKLSIYLEKLAVHQSLLESINTRSNAAVAILKKEGGFYAKSKDVEEMM